MSTSIKAIKESLEAITSLSDPLFQELATDARLGVQKALKSRQKAIQAELAEEERLEAMLSYEKALCFIKKVIKPLQVLMRWDVVP